MNEKYNDTDLTDDEVEELIKKYSKKYNSAPDSEWLREYDRKVLLADRKEKLKKLNGRTDLNN